MQSRDSWHGWLLDHTWVVEVAIVVLLLFFLNFGLKRFLIRSKRMAQLQENDWRVHLDYAAVAPARVLLWVLLIAFLIDVVTRELKLSGTFLYVDPLRNATVIGCIAWFLLRWKKVFHTTMVSKRGKGKVAFDPISLEIVAKLFTISVIFISLLVVMQIFGLNVAPLITFGGIGAAVLGFASKDVVANFFGGLMIYVTRPFTVHDLVELPEKKVMGHVEEIGWYLTSIRDLEKKPIYIPNSIFSSELLINQSRMTHRRIEETIQIRYEDISKVGKILDEIRSLFDRNASIDHHQSLSIFLQNFSPSSVDLEVKAYLLSTRYEDFMEARQAVMLEMYDIVARNGAEMAYPTMRILGGV